MYCYSNIIQFVSILKLSGFCQNFHLSKSNATESHRFPGQGMNTVNSVLKGGVHDSAHVHESKYFFAFARYDPSLLNLICCL